MTLPYVRSAIKSGSIIVQNTFSEVGVGDNPGAVQTLPTEHPVFRMPLPLF